MNWYNIYKDEWRSIIETVASEENRMPQMVEKDTIQSMILFELSKCVVFQLKCNMVLHLL